MKYLIYNPKRSVNEIEEVAFYAKQGITEVAMELAIAQEFEVVSDGTWLLSMTSDESFITGWKESASLEEKMDCSIDILNTFGDNVYAIEEEKYTIISAEKDEVVFSTLFEYDGEEVGIIVSAKIINKSVLLSFFVEENSKTLDEFDFLFLSKEYPLPDTKACLNASFNTDAIDREDNTLLLPLISSASNFLLPTGSSASVYFSLNGEGVLFNELLIDGDGELADWNGYIELDDFIEC